MANLPDYVRTLTYEPHRRANDATHLASVDFIPNIRIPGALDPFFMVELALTDIIRLECLADPR